MIIYEKQTVFYNKKDGDREKTERENAVLKAMEFVKNSNGTTPTFNYDKLAEQEKVERNFKK